MTSSIDLSKAPFKEERTDLVFLARVAEAAERFDDMCAIMKRIAHMKVALTEDERNLLSVAFKNAIGSRRAAWRTLHAEEYKGNELIKFYEDFIEPEFGGLCNDVLSLLNDYLIPAATSSTDDHVSICFYYKMAGDYSRYQAEFRPDGEHRNKAEDYYAKAWQVAVNLPTTHPVRLGLALNYSVCYYEVLKNPEKAIQIARDAFDHGIAHLDKLDENDYKDATAILQLIRDNLTLWAGGGGEAHDGGEAAQHDGGHEHHAATEHVEVGSAETPAAAATPEVAAATEAATEAPPAEAPKTDEPAATT